MRRATGLGAVTAVGLAVLAGCGPEKHLPTDVTPQTTTEAAKPAAVPDKSQPEALKLTEKWLAAVTDGHPDRLARVKTFTQSAKGTFRWPTYYSAATRSIQAVWPDRFRVTWDYQTGDIKQTQIGLHRPDVWTLTTRANGGAEPVKEGSPDEEQLVVVDVVGQVWMPVLVPLTDPKTVAFGARKDKLGAAAVDVVQLSVPGCPVYSLWADEKSGLLRLVTYTHKEGGTAIQKQVAVADQKPFGGVLLPTELEYLRNGTAVEKWTVTACDPADKIDDATFNRPADKK